MVIDALFSTDLHPPDQTRLQHKWPALFDVPNRGSHTLLSQNPLTNDDKLRINNPSTITAHYSLDTNSDIYFEIPLVTFHLSITTPPPESCAHTRCTHIPFYARYMNYASTWWTLVFRPVVYQLLLFALPILSAS